MKKSGSCKKNLEKSSTIFVDRSPSYFTRSSVTAVRLDNRENFLPSTDQSPRNIISRVSYFFFFLPPLLLRNDPIARTRIIVPVSLRVVSGRLRFHVVSVCFFFLDGNERCNSKISPCAFIRRAHRFVEIVAEHRRRTDR